MGKTKPPSDAIVQTVHVEGITYQLRYTRCGKRDGCRKGCDEGPSHGPYWYATTWAKGKTKTFYVGKELPRIDQLADRPESR